MDPKSLKLVSEGTLQARHFAEIGLSRRQLHVWCEKTGFEPSARVPGRWRLFSPAEVLQLTTVRELKARTGLAITDHRDLIEFIGSQDDFLVPTLGLWREGKSPTLLTDLATIFEIGHAAFARVDDLLESSPFLCVLSLQSPIGLMLSAVENGGSFDQRLWAAMLTETRDAIMKMQEPCDTVIESAPSGPARHPTTETEQLVPRRRHGHRDLDLGQKA